MAIKMAIKLEDVPVVKAEPGGRKQRTKKEKYTNAHLPFPSKQFGQSMKNWRKVFKPSIIGWAGTVEDPFGTNSILSSPVKKVWNDIFPDLKDCFKDVDQRAAILGVVRTLSTLVSQLLMIFP